MNQNYEKLIETEMIFGINLKDLVALILTYRKGIYFSNKQLKNCF